MLEVGQGNTPDTGKQVMSEMDIENINTYYTLILTADAK